MNDTFSNKHELGTGSPADESRDELPHAGNSVPNLSSSLTDDDQVELELQGLKDTFSNEHGLGDEDALETGSPVDPEDNAAIDENIPPCSPRNEEGVTPEQQQDSLGFFFPAVDTVPTSTPTILSLLNLNNELPETVVPTPVPSMPGDLNMIDPCLRDDIIASSPIVGTSTPSNIQTMTTSSKHKKGKKNHQSKVQKEKTIPADSGGRGQRTCKAVSKDVVPLTDSPRAYPSWLKNVMEAATDLHLGTAWQLCVDAWLTFEKSFPLEEVTSVSVFFVFKTILTSFISVPLTKQRISAPNRD